LFSRIAAPGPGTHTLRQRVGVFEFLPLVSKRLELMATLDILMLRPEPPGQILSQGGDIDNRLKTLLDALQMPRAEQISPTDQPKVDEVPFYCLLEDDHLITSLRVTTDRLLDCPVGGTEVLLIIHVETEFTHQNFSNMISFPRVQES